MLTAKLIITISSLIAVIKTASDVNQNQSSQKTQEQSSNSLTDDPPLFPFKPDVGYLDVLPDWNPDKSENQMFYWHFKAKNSPETAPLLIWLDGGPGCAGTFGMFFNTGPLEVEDFQYDQKTKKWTGKKQATLKPNSWGDNYNLLFPDNPIGVGFSVN
jgi:carboxypeptidase C (cathepsin A)